MSDPMMEVMEDMNCMMFGFCKKRHLKDLNLKEKEKE